MKIGVFIDIMSQYNAIKKKWPGHRLDYRAYLDACLLEKEDIVIQAVAYGCQFQDEAKTFILSLKNAGYIVKYKPPKILRTTAEGKKVWKNNWEIGLTLDVAEMLGKMDKVILGVSDGVYIPLVEYVRNKGIVCCIFSSEINRALSKFANETIEIDKDLLMPDDTHHTTK